MTTWLPWALVVLLGALCLWLLLRSRAGAGLAAPSASPARPSETTPGQGAGDEDAALKGLFRYLEEAVLAPLQAARGGSGKARVDDAVNALEDLAFFAKDLSREVAGTENLGAVVQAVTREYALDTGVAVRFSAPADVLVVHLAPESFKDALYLVLANAGRFGKGSTVDVVAEPAGDQVKLLVRDRGPGFTQEALYRAFEPFWTTERDALGLGLTHARKVLAEQGADVSVRNRAGGGGEVEILLRRAKGRR
jgi:signal transduction histidine kinase